MKYLMAANWKMHKTPSEADKTARDLVDLVEKKLPRDREVLVCPTATCLRDVAWAFSEPRGFFVGGQNFYPEDEGAFTGEVSAPMLLESGCAYALAGHSERRHVFGEDDAFIGRKVVHGLSRGLSMILCIGETIEQRKAGKVEEVIRTQLSAGLADVDKNLDPPTLSVAYEPVWAIGTGETAETGDIAHAHDFTRSVLEDILGEKSREVRLLYGGSVKPANASQIISLDNVNGVLVGGASLKADSFSEIILAPEDKA